VTNWTFSWRATIAPAPFMAKGVQREPQCEPQQDRGQQIQMTEGISARWTEVLTDGTSYYGDAIRPNPHAPMPRTFSVMSRPRRSEQDLGPSGRSFPG
jgi:hypothetical protein